MMNFFIILAVLIVLISTWLVTLLPTIILAWIGGIDLVIIVGLLLAYGLITLLAKAQAD